MIAPSRFWRLLHRIYLKIVQLSSISLQGRTRLSSSAKPTRDGVDYRNVVILSGPTPASFMPLSSPWPRGRFPYPFSSFFSSWGKIPPMPPFFLFSWPRGPSPILLTLFTDKKTNQLTVLYKVLNQLSQ
jgi:hypothetical protein